MSSTSTFQSSQSIFMLISYYCTMGLLVVRRVNSLATFRFYFSFFIFYFNLLWKCRSRLATSLNHNVPIRDITPHTRLVFQEMRHQEKQRDIGFVHAREWNVVWKELDSTWRLLSCNRRICLFEMRRGRWRREAGQDKAKALKFYIKIVEQVVGERTTLSKQSNSRNVNIAHFT